MNFTKDLESQRIVQQLFTVHKTKSAVMRASGLGYRRVTSLLEGRPRKKRKKSYDDDDVDKLKEIITEEPELFLEEMKVPMLLRTEKLFSTTTLWRMVHELNIVKKKVYEEAIERYSPEALKRRLEYFAEIARVPKEKLVFVDETGIEAHSMLRKKAWARRGKAARILRTYVRKQKFNVLSCISWEGLVSFRITDTNVGTSDFNDYMIDCVVTQVPEGSVIVVDNASFHRDEVLPTIVELLNRKLVYLPPYAPDLNPIEISYAFVKQDLKV
jgi:hypothetical protein